MLPAVVVAYVGEGTRALDVVQVLDQRLQRPVHALRTTTEEVEAVLADDRVDCVVCGGSLEGDDLQRVVDAVADEAGPSLPVFDLTEAVAAVPDPVDIHHLYPGTDQRAAADELVGAVLDASLGQSSDDDPAADLIPRGLDEYFAVDAAWRVTDWDPRLEDRTGVRPSEAVGEELWTVLPEWAETELGAVHREAMTTRDPMTTDVYHEPADRWLEVRVVPTDDGGLESFTRDVTAQRRQAAELEETRERLDNTLERIADAFFALDNEETFVYLNSQAEFVLDVDADEVEGVRFWDAFPAAVSTTFYQEFNEAMDTQEPTSFEEYYRPLDAWFEVNAYPSEDGLSVFLRDVTEQVRLTRRLESLHDTARHLIVAESDAEIGENAVEAAVEVLDFPLTVCWRFDRTRERLEPLAWSEDVAERVDDLPAVDRDARDLIWDVYDDEEARNMGFVPATTNTSHHPGEVTSQLLVPLGEFGVFGTYADERDAFDNTDVELFRILASAVRSALARARRERQLARRNERLNDFASVVSHDLRNPLQVAQARAEIAADSGDLEHLETVTENLDRMETLIEDLLERARGDQDLERRPISLRAIATDAWDAVETPEATFSLEREAEFNADPNRLRQLFENLYRNAVEHGSTSPPSQAQGDAVEHGGRDVDVRVGALENGFFVADDGEGIPEDRREEVFEQGVSGSAEGTGFGLAIVTDIVEGHGWTIDVTDSDAGGARFEVRNIYSLEPAEEATVE